MQAETEREKNKMYKYRVETHLHTSQGSACAVSTGAEMASGSKQYGCCAIVVTDHFFNGNTAVRENLSWDEKITLFMQGYEDAKCEGDKIGLNVFFGFEYNSNGAEFLIYNYGEEKLRAYPEIMSDSLEMVLSKIRNEGGFVVHAHPFRDELYIRQPGRIFPKLVDAVEVINTKNRNEVNRSALKYAEKYDLIKFSGSDTHRNDPEEGGLMLARKPESISDIIDMARKNEYIMLGESFLK